MKPQPTAAWPTDSLATSLSRAGWGDLSGRSMQGIRSTLRALIDLLPHRSGEGLATAPQVADAAGLSLRWTRRCLHMLEDAGIISWTRGGVVAGKPTPGVFRVRKRVLVALIGGARPMLAAVQRARAEQTALRLRGVRFLKARGRQTRRSDHVALSADPHPLQGRSRASSTPVDDEIPLHLTEVHARTASAGAEAVRAAMAAARRGSQTGSRR